MNVYREHRLLADRLLKDPVALQEQSTQTDWNLAHIAMGIMGESAEYMLAVLKSDYKNAKEEAGDLLFFLAALETAFNFNVEMRNFAFAPKTVLSYGTELGDLLKKAVIYKKPLDRLRLIRNAQELYYQIDLDMSLLDTTTDQLRQQNIAKLRTRYPTGYSDQSASVRADKEYRHKKRGTTYRVLEVKEFDFGPLPVYDGTHFTCPYVKIPIADITAAAREPIFMLQTEAPLTRHVMTVFYRDTTKPMYFARPLTEFMDGRFEEVE